MSNALPTAPELHAVLMKTALPTILVEGTTDAQVLRHLENRLATHLPIRPNILPCGGRPILLQVFDLVKKRPPKKANRILYLADRDMWLFSSVPPQFSDIIFTNGYSIENDLYAGSAIEKLLEKGSEDVRFENVVRQLSHWIAFEVNEFKAGRPHEVSPNVAAVVTDDGSGLKATFCAKRNYVAQSATEVDELVAKYASHLPGKKIFEALSQILSSPGRAAKYSRKHLHEICLKLCDENQNVQRLLAALHSGLTA
jgi:hypothetical protein